MVSSNCEALSKLRLKELDLAWAKNKAAANVDALLQNKDSDEYKMKVVAYNLILWQQIDNWKAIRAKGGTTEYDPDEVYPWLRE